MTDSSEAEIPPQTNGLSDSMDDEERAKIRPVEIDADVREMERRKRVELIMNSKMFREELERIIETQLKDGSGTTGLMQQISDMMGVNKQAGNVFKNSNCVVPINDIRGIEAMSYGKGEKILRCKLAAVFRLIDLYGWIQGSNSLVTARLNQDEEHFLVNPYGMMFHEITASSLIKVAMQGNVIEQGTTNFSVNISAFSLHAAVHAARPDIKCIINVHTPSVVAVSALKHGILPLSQESVVIGDVSTHTYLGGLLDPEEKDKLARNLGPNNKVLLLSNQGALCCGETIEEAFFNARNTVLACESQLKLIPVGLDNLVLLNDEIRKKLYDAAHKAPESSPRPDQPSILEGKVERKWRVGGVEFEALMRMLDNAGFRTGYIYRHPLIKGEVPRPKNDVEVPPAVSSLGYLLEEEELYRQGLWKKLEGGRKGHDRSRWLNSPNVYQKVEILETGTPDPKKITKWVAEGSPTHSSTPVKIESALQFVPKGTNPKEFKMKQQQIKDYRRADKISAGPQSHILEGVTWEEARKMQDATVTQTGDQVVLMGAASKGIIQRGHQHNAMVYKSPYAKNPFDSITDEELDEYKKVVEKKTKGEYDTDYSESEGLSSAQINKRMSDIRSPTSVTSETEEESRDEPQVLRIETKTAPKPSQPEIVLSDAESSATERFLRAERVSVNSYKSVRVAKRTKRLFTSLPYYRTNNFSGLPKGSYAVPNPTHFHIVRYQNLAPPLRPVLVKIGPQSRSPHYVFNRFNVSCNKNNQIVTINIGNYRAVSLTMSLQTITDFVKPFANALNILNEPQVNNSEAQTTYLVPKKEENTCEYTPLIENFERSENTVKDSSKFEKEILQKLKKNIMTDFNNIDCESEFSESKDLDEIADFTDKDSITINESLADENYSEHFEFGSEKSPENQDNSLEISDMSFEINEIETQTNDSLEVQKNSTLSLPEISETYDNNISSSSPSTDEGICDLTKSLPDNQTIDNVDNNIVKLGQIIFEYMSEQGFDLSDLVIFPELSQDANTNKLMNKLRETFEEIYANKLSVDELSYLRLTLCKYVLSLIEKDERMISSTDSLEYPMVSDKLFSVSETLSAILDQFFEMIDIPKQQEIQTFEGVIHHSTPEKITIDNNQVYETIEEVTTFKQDIAEKPGYESYWFAVGSPKDQKIKKSTTKTIINVDEIPLPFPKDFNSFSSSRPLSPILEEANRNLLLDFNKADQEDILAGGDTSKIEEVFSKNNSGAYIAFDRPESNVIVSTGVTFSRTITTVTSAYVKADSVIFKKCNSDRDENSNCIVKSEKKESEDEGDWMGYEKAKF